MKKTMTNPLSVNSQLQQLAEEAVKAAAEKFGQSLDYTENSLSRFEALLQQAYELYTSKESGKNIPEETIQITARAWGSYLGELMRRKWGGEWVLTGPAVELTINGKYYSPIQQIFKRITIGQLYNTREYLANIASEMAEPKREEVTKAIKKARVRELMSLPKQEKSIENIPSDMAKPMREHAAPALDETTVEDKIEKPKEFIKDVSSVPADPKREQAAQAPYEMAVSEQIDLLKALLVEQKEQAKTLKAIRGRLGNPVANILILILVLTGIVYLIYILMT
jgi:hypothetical protein